MTDAQAQAMSDSLAAIQQYTQDSDSIHRELLAHAAFQSNLLVSLVVVVIVLSFICAFRKGGALS